MSGNQEFISRLSTSACDRSMDPDRHVYVSYLQVVDIVTQKSRRYMPHEFSIDNLLYANLKLERLVNEYEGLRERSKSVLTGLNVPYLYGSRNFNNLMKKKNDALNQSINRVANQTASLTGLLANPNRLKKKNFSAFAKENQTENKRRLTFERRAISYSSGGASSLNEYSEEQTLKNIEPASDSAEAIQKFRYGVQQEEHLPWLARTTRALFIYFRENKVETIVFILLLFIVHQLIFASRK